MSRTNFDYNFTCPQIDKEIRRAKCEIESFLDDLLSDACGLLTIKLRKEMSEQYAANLYGRLEEVFETTRRTNEQMREAAESQISDLKEEVATLKSHVEQLEREAA